MDLLQETVHWWLMYNDNNPDSWEFCKHGCNLGSWKVFDLKDSLWSIHQFKLWEESMLTYSRYCIDSRAKRSTGWFQRFVFVRAPAVSTSEFWNVCLPNTRRGWGFGCILRMFPVAFSPLQSHFEGSVVSWMQMFRCSNHQPANARSLVQQNRVNLLQKLEAEWLEKALRAILAGKTKVQVQQGVESAK